MTPTGDWGAGRVELLQFNIGARWDLQQIRGNGGVTYLKLNNLFDNLRVAKANLPNWFSADTVTTGAIVSAIAFAVGGALSTRRENTANFAATGVGTRGAYDQVEIMQAGL